jgi:putative transposase
MADRYQSSAKKSTKKFEVMGRKEVAVRLSLPLLKVWKELQPEVEHLTGLAGLKIIRAVIEDEVMRRVGPRHQPDPASSCLRWGQQSGYVVFAGQKVAVERPRVRTRQGEEVQLDSYARLQHDGRRQRAVREGIVAGLTSRNYRRAVQSVLDGYGIEKSSVSREFVQASAAQLKTLCEKKLNELELVAVLIDGIHLGQQVQVVALGIESSGKKHVLGLWQGATENTTVVQALLEDLEGRGLNPKRRYLFVIDGAKALRAGIERVFGERAEVQRCQIHKRRNVKEHLPKSAPGDTDRRIRNAYAMTSYADAKAELGKIFRQLERINPSAAHSLEEGLEETLTVHRLGVGTLLRQTLASSNPIESCFSIVEKVARNVKRWRAGNYALRWTATGLLEAEKKFR